MVKYHESIGTQLYSKCLVDSNGDGDCATCTRYGEDSLCRRWMRVGEWGANQVLPLNAEPSAHDLMFAKMREWYEREGWTEATKKFRGSYKYSEPVYVWTLPDNNSFGGTAREYEQDMGHPPTTEDIKFWWWRYIVNVERPATDDEVREWKAGNGTCSERS